MENLKHFILYYLINLGKRSLIINNNVTLKKKNLCRREKILCRFTKIISFCPLLPYINTPQKSGGILCRLFLFTKVALNFSLNLSVKNKKRRKENEFLSLFSFFVIKIILSAKTKIHFILLL